MNRQRNLYTLAVFLWVLVLTGCSGPSALERKSFNDSIAAGNYTDALAKITALKDKTYTKKNAVLFYLDIGAVQHDAGQYQDSNNNFASAEDLMDELYTKSVTRETGRFLLNDNTVAYSGEHFERVLVNVYRALDYVGMNDQEDALVEIRKISRLLQEYVDTTAGSSVTYKDDAFAQYLSALMYADINQKDDARISLQDAQKAYGDYAKHYGTPVPDLGEPALDQNAAELVFIHGNGVAPHKVSRSFQVAWNDAIAAVSYSQNDEQDAGQALNAIRAGLTGNAITVAYPAYTQSPYRIVSSTVDCDGTSASTWLAEDITQIATHDLDDREALIKTRAIARAAIKYILGRIATDKMRQDYGNGSVQALLMQVTTSVGAAVTEVADTRAWATLPAQFRIARVKLSPGEHDITVHYKDGNGMDVLTRTFHVTLTKGQRTYLYDRTAL